MNRRRFLAGSSLTLAALALQACSSAPARPRTGTDAIVDAAFTGKPGTLTEGLPTYRTLHEALEAAPVFSKGWNIRVKPGTYKEKLTITQSGVRLIGENRDDTIITFDAVAGAPRTDGSGNWGTAGSATLTVRASDFLAENLTIRNSFDYPANRARGSAHPDYIRSSQAVAVYLTTGADRSAFRNVALHGYQDTLFADVGRACFEECLITGNVDFIFGGARAWFESCEIRMRSGGRTERPIGWLTAPSTQIRQRYGLVFNRCRLTRDADVLDGSTALGRPWHPSADPDAIGQSVFLDCWMDAHISASGWDSMSSTTKSGDRVTFKPEDSRFFEHRSIGPGANPARRQLEMNRRKEFSRDQVLGGWAS